MGRWGEGVDSQGWQVTRRARGVALVQRGRRAGCWTSGPLPCSTAPRPVGLALAGGCGWGLEGVPGLGLQGRSACFCSKWFSRPAWACCVGTRLGSATQGGGYQEEKRRACPRHGSPTGPCPPPSASPLPTAEVLSWGGLGQLWAVEEESPPPQSGLGPTDGALTAGSGETPAGRRPEPGSEVPRAPTKSSPAGWPRPGAGSPPRVRAQAPCSSLEAWRGGGGPASRGPCSPSPEQARTPARPLHNIVYFRLGLRSGPGSQRPAGQAPPVPAPAATAPRAARRSVPAGPAGWCPWVPGPLQAALLYGLLHVYASETQRVQWGGGLGWAALRCPPGHKLGPAGAQAMGGGAQKLGRCVALAQSPGAGRTHVDPRPGPATNKEQKWGE